MCTMQARSARRAMPPTERGRFLKRYWPGISLSILGCKRMGGVWRCSPASLRSCLLTRVNINFSDVAALGFRSFRDFFAMDVYTLLLNRSPRPQDYLAADWPGKRGGMKDRRGFKTPLLQN
jgi:hypothetical protein